MSLKIQIEEIVRDLYEIDATDIHFQPFEQQTKVYYRKSGQLFEYSTLKTEEYLRLINYIKYRSNLNISQSQKPQDGAIEFVIDQQKVNVRVSTVPLIEYESLVLRIIPGTIKRHLMDLTWNVETYNAIKQLVTHNVGLFVFTGPTGSGKTTVMYHILKHLATEQQFKVITIENPIEIRNELFVQMQINEHKNINYEMALKSVLRQDPDVIMIGEVRDYLTAKAVMSAALTGHTIITTMHTKNKYGVIERFRDFGFNDSEIYSVLIGICNQRLLKFETETKVFIDFIDLYQYNGKWGGDEQEITTKISVFKQRYQKEE